MILYSNAFGGTATTRSNSEYSFSPQIIIAFSSRARSDLLGACRSRFLLGEESEVKLEQFELGTLRESTLPRYYLVIHFSQFLPTKDSVRKIKR